MGNQVPMDELIEVARILDVCLTEKTLNRLAPGIVVFSDLKGEGVRKKLFVDLLEHAGNELMRELNRELSPGEVILTFNRVKQLLTVRGLY
jgi:hypothetical protein